MIIVRAQPEGTVWVVWGIVLVISVTSFVVLAEDASPDPETVLDTELEVGPETVLDTELEVVPTPEPDTEPLLVPELDEGPPINCNTDKLIVMMENNET
jgi:hypothetical protein